jgi:hypothetical protein
MLFPDPGKLTQSIYAALNKLTDTLKKRDILMSEFIAPAIKNLQTDNPESSFDSREILEILNITVNDLIGEEKSKEESVTTPVREFKNKNKRANRVTKGDSCKFELKGFTKNTYNELENRIAEILKDFE